MTAKTELLTSPKGQIEDGLEQTQVRCVLNVKKNFGEIDNILDNPFSVNRQNPLNSRFKTSCGRIFTIGQTELKLGIAARPKFGHWQDQWNDRRTLAVKTGYGIKTFNEYGQEILAESKRTNNKISPVV